MILVEHHLLLMISSGSSCPLLLLLMEEKSLICGCLGCIEEWGLVGWLVSYDQRESNRGSDCACSDDCHAGGRGGGHFRWLDFLFSGWIWFGLASWEYESLYRLSLQTLAEVVVIQYVARSEV